MSVVKIFQFKCDYKESVWPEFVVEVFGEYYIFNDISNMEKIHSFHPIKKYEYDKSQYELMAEYDSIYTANYYLPLEYPEYYV